MTEQQQFSSVSKMLDSISDDHEFTEEVRRHIAERRIVKALHAMRTAKGISQSDVAKHLDCSQSRLSKIEHGIDSELRVGELEAYAKAMECDVHILFTKRNSRAIDRIKHYAFLMHVELLRLAELANHDEEIAMGVASTFGEVLINQMDLLQLAASKLPNNPQTDEPYLKIDTQIEECRDSSDDEDSKDESTRRPPRRVRFRG